jgi:hypothetical protein
MLGSPSLESFRNHWRSANGPNARKRDWQAAWANWIIEQDNRDGRRTNTLGRHQPADGLSSTARARSQVFGPPETDQRSFRNELTACLALVAPVGMTEEGETRLAGGGMGDAQPHSADLLSIGCKAARQKCDHPSKIVPIIAETKDGRRDRADRLCSRVYEQPRRIIAGRGQGGDHVRTVA